MNAAMLLSLVLNAVAIEHVRVEVGDGRVLEDVTVVIDGERIVSVGPAAPASVTLRIDGTARRSRRASSTRPRRWESRRSSKSLDRRRVAQRRGDGAGLPRGRRLQSALESHSVGA